MHIFAQGWLSNMGLFCHISNVSQRGERCTIVTYHRGNTTVFTVLAYANTWQWIYVAMV